LPTEPAGRTAPGTIASRLRVRKTYKLYIGGAFPRSESGRSYPVRAARKAFAGWSGATAYNRGQVLYRVAEMLDGRREQFATEIADCEGGSSAAALEQVDAAIDRWVYYAGWADKYAQVVGATNPVAGSYFSFSLPEPTGVVGLVAPQDSSLLGLVGVLAPVLATGNTAVVIAAESRPLPASSFAEVLATSDLPGGVVNLLTGRTAELSPWLAGHRDVNALDLTGVAVDDRKALQIMAADNVKRVFAPPAPDWSADPGISRLGAFVEIKTVWHPIGV
jgi:acyl-CoA reductase-like NAD-dependent aldehyde dehydrogenase